MFSTLRALQARASPTHTHRHCHTPSRMFFLKNFLCETIKEEFSKFFLCRRSWQLIRYKSAHPWWYFQSKQRWAWDRFYDTFLVRLLYAFREHKWNWLFSVYVFAKATFLCHSCVNSNLKHFSACGDVTIVMSLTQIFFSTKSESFARRCVQSLRFVSAGWKITSFKCRPLSFRAKTLIIID